ncbi:MAG TPA: hypothetical protein VJR89_19570 [Polyangiales bacterium]|nr:hypothetical protein [Polyangiales bacterium]
MATHLQDIVNSENIEHAREQLAKVSGELEHVDRRVRAFVQERPIMSLLAAAFVGHLLGRVVAATR